MRIRMKLSIIVPVYNMAGGNKLNYCMDSLLAQKMEDYEILAVDDASTDGSYGILEEYAARYPDRVTAIRSPENRKQGGARNIGIERARGEWIGFVDADDWVSPDMYRKLLEKAEETGADLVGCQYQLTDRHSMDPGRTIINNTMDQTGVLGEAQYRRLILKPGSMVIKIYRKEVIDRYHLRFPEKIFYEDNAAGPLWMLRFTHFELVDEPLYYYYQHEASTVHGISEERCRNRMYAAKLLIDGSKEAGYYETYRAELEARFLQLYYVNTLFSYMAGIRFPKLSFLRELKNGVLAVAPKFSENPYYADMYDQEQRRMMELHMKNSMVYILYDRLLWGYRRLRYGKKRR